MRPLDRTAAERGPSNRNNNDKGTGKRLHGERDISDAALGTHGGRARYQQGKLTTITDRDFDFNRLGNDFSAKDL